MTKPLATGEHDAALSTDPSPSQEVAAELLGLPLRTYPRHLARGTAELTDLLWAVEINATELQVSNK